LKFYGFTDTLSHVDVEIDGAGIVRLNSIEQNLQSFGSGYRNVLEGKTLPLYLQYASSYYQYTYLPSSKTFYIAYNKCANAPNLSFADFTNQIIDSLSSSQVDKVVIDLRNNGGGNSSVINPLLSYLEASSFNADGKLFVLTGNRTFSSALLNAISFKQNTECRLVGGPAGGKPNSYGEVQTFALPNSGIVAQYTTKFFSEMSGDPVALFPDDPVDLTGQDFINGRDPVLEYVLNY
jgi:hypothetical protein